MILGKRSGTNKCSFPPQKITYLGISFIILEDCITYQEHMRMRMILRIEQTFLFGVMIQQLRSGNRFRTVKLMVKSVHFTSHKVDQSSSPLGENHLEKCL